MLAGGAILASNAAAGSAGSAYTTASEIAAFQSARRFERTSFGQIAVVEKGAGPAAIFLHGWPLNGFQWRGALRRLSDLRRCVAPDFMGLGHSEVARETDLSPTRQADMISELMERLSIDRADFVANDSGTAVAQLLAVRHPHRVRTLLLTNGDVDTNSPPQALKPAIEAARAGKLASMIRRHLEEPGFAASPMGLGWIAYTDPKFLTPEIMRAYFEPLLASPVREAQFQQYGVAFEPNPLPAIEQQLAACQIPTRMLWGTADIHFATYWAHWLDGKLPKSRGVRLVPGANLFFVEEMPDLVAAEAIDLWSSVKA
jgi:pimeloyl-ACP methyl ester carboxylesterase